MCNIWKWLYIDQGAGKEIVCDSIYSFFQHKKPSGHFIDLISEWVSARDPSARPNIPTLPDPVVINPPHSIYKENSVLKKSSKIFCQRSISKTKHFPRPHQPFFFLLLSPLFLYSSEQSHNKTLPEEDTFFRNSLLKPSANIEESVPISVQEQEGGGR